MPLESTALDDEHVLLTAGETEQVTGIKAKSTIQQMCSINIAD